MYVLEIFEGDNYYLSSKELCEQAVEIFELEEDEYCIEKMRCDDEDILDRIKVLKG